MEKTRMKNYEIQDLINSNSEIKKRTKFLEKNIVDMKLLICMQLITLPNQ
jgi:hypothetical protein